MIDAWGVWLLVVGFAVGAATLTVLLVRLPRREDDVDRSERRSEATWIAGIIERYGGVAPVSLVEEVLDLHAAYLEQPRPPRPPSGQAAGTHSPDTWDPRMVPPVTAAPLSGSPARHPPPGPPPGPLLGSPPGSPPPDPPAGYPPPPRPPAGR